MRVFKCWTSALGIGVAIALAAENASADPTPPSYESDLAARDVAIAAGLPSFPEVAADGDIPMLYGRVWVTELKQVKLLDLLRFSHADRPFFDEWEWSRNAPPTEGVSGHWEYAIATSVQWKALAKTGLVAAVTVNPTWDASPHPLLASFQKPDGSLRLDALANAGFRLPERRFDPNGGALCTTTLTPESWFGDAWSTVANAIGGAIGDIIAAAEAGAAWAVDKLRELGNAGFCAVAGSYYHRGKIFVRDPERSQDTNGNDIPRNSRRIQRRYPFGTGGDLPILGGTVFARGGAGGVLLTNAAIDPETGEYSFKDLCNTLSYSLVLGGESPYAFVAAFSDLPTNAALGTVHAGDWRKEWDITDLVGETLLGAQVGHEVAQTEFGIVPYRKPRFGVYTNAFLTDLTNASVTPCGAANRISGAVAQVGLLGTSLLTSTFLDKDIYLKTQDVHPYESGREDPFGVVVHEYGHFADCSALHAHGNMNAFLNAFTRLIIDSDLKNDVQLQSPMRQSAESFADLFSYAARGHTDYFTNAKGNGSAVSASTERVSYVCRDPGRRCLEADAAFNTAGSDDSHEKIAARTSIAYDWVDTFGLASSSPEGGWTNGGDDDRVFTPMRNIAAAFGDIGAEPTTEKAALYLVNRFGISSDAMCATFKQHGWADCPGLGQTGRLDGPETLVGIPDVSSVRWRWTSTSALAQKFAVIGLENGVERELKVVDAATRTYATGFLPPNTESTVLIEARTATPGVLGRSIRVRQCSLAGLPGGVSADETDAGIVVAWGAARASGYRLERAIGDGSTFETLADLGNVTAFTDVSAPPGVRVTYRLRATNCTGVVSAQSVQTVLTTRTDDPRAVYVRVGGDGDGGRANPFGTLAKAVALLRANPSKTRILVAGGLYDEPIDLFGGGAPPAAIFGGYLDSFEGRDFANHATRVTGGATPAQGLYGASREDVGVSGLVVVAATAPLVLDGIVLDPGSRPCTTACGAISLVSNSAETTLRHVVYGGQVRGTSPDLPLIAVQNGTLRVIDSDITEPQQSPNGIVRGDTVLVEGSRIIAQSVEAPAMFAVRGFGPTISADHATVTRSIIRQYSLSTWVPAGKGIYARCADVRGSIVAAAEPLTTTNACDTSVIAQSLLYGQTRAFAKIINNVFVADLGPALTVTHGALVAPTPIVRNLFVGPNVAPIQGLSFLDENKQNTFVASLSALKFMTPVETLPSNFGKAFHADHSTYPNDPFGGAVRLEDYGISVERDLDGNTRQGIGSNWVGPYAYLP